MMMMTMVMIDDDDDHDDIGINGDRNLLSLHGERYSTILRLLDNWLPEHSTNLITTITASHHHHHHHHHLYTISKPPVSAVLFLALSTVTSSMIGNNTDLQI